MDNQAGYGSTTEVCGGVLGITSVQQHLQHISSVQVAKQFGMEESLENMIKETEMAWPLG